MLYFQCFQEILRRHKWLLGMTVRTFFDTLRLLQRERFAAAKVILCKTDRIRKGDACCAFVAELAVQSDHGIVVGVVVTLVRNIA